MFQCSFNLAIFKEKRLRDPTAAMDFFWEHFDPTMYSILFCTHKNPKQLGLLSETISFFKDLRGTLKSTFWTDSFASMCLFGVDNNSTISGVWVCNNTALESENCLQTICEMYNFSLMNHEDNETKALVNKYILLQPDLDDKTPFKGIVLK